MKVEPTGFADVLYVGFEGVWEKSGVYTEARGVF